MQTGQFIVQNWFKKTGWLTKLFNKKLWLTKLVKKKTFIVN
jgi:hypothetical protein